MILLFIFRLFSQTSLALGINWHKLYFIYDALIVLRLEITMFLVFLHLKGHEIEQIPLTPLSLCE